MTQGKSCNAHISKIWYTENNLLILNYNWLFVNHNINTDLLLIRMAAMARSINQSINLSMSNP